MNNPLLKEALQFEPLRVFKTAEKLMHIYREWRTGDVAWKMQVSGHLSISINLLTLIQSQLPEGATLLGTLISSDKTTISAMTGNRVAHPLLISLADIVMDF